MWIDILDPLHSLDRSSPFQELCQYINTNWVDALFAQPTTWARLFVHVRTSQSLEERDGVPQLGWTPWKRSPTLNMLA